jgi:hypothetical protein
VTTTVIINDFVKDRRSVIVFHEPDFMSVEEHWEKSDRLLADLQDHPAFTKRERWCDLNPTHYRLLLMSNLKKLAALSDDEMKTPNNATISSLQFLICALIYCLQRRTESLIEMMRINRIGDHEVAYDYAASLNMAVDLPRKDGGPKGGLRVIVNNSDT